MTGLSKLQIRAKVMSQIAEIKSSPEYNEDLLRKLIEEFEPIEDKKSLLGIFLKEYMKMNEEECMFSACLLKEIIPLDYISEQAMEYIKTKALSDEVKYKFVQLLRISGIPCDFNEIPSYFEEPDTVLDLETQKLLEKAVFNPESMLDFLDFVSAVSQKDRNILLKSLAIDYQGDMLANIVYPVLYSDFDEEFILSAVEILSDSKSSLAIEPFEYLIKTSNNHDIVNACMLGLKKLKLAGASKEKALSYFCSAVADSVPAEFYTTIPDGNSNQAFLISRKTTQNKYLLAAIVISDKTGIVDTFGFYNISSSELMKVTAKFYKSEGKYRVSPEYTKTRILEAYNVTVGQKRKFPYEFICWFPLLSDIKPLEQSIQDYVDSCFSSKVCKKNEICSLLTKEHTFRWFIGVTDNKLIKSIFDNFYKQDVYEIDILNSGLKNNLDNVFNKDTELLWKQKLYNLIYLLSCSNESEDAAKYYNLLKDEEIFHLFKTIILQRSIFNYAVCIYENSKSSSFPVNIFKKRNSPESEYDIKKIEKIIELLKEKWIDG